MWVSGMDVLRRVLLLPKDSYATCGSRLSLIEKLYTI